MGTYVGQERMTIIRLSILIIIAFCSSSLYAEEVSKSAEELLQEGQAAFDQGDSLKAASLFEQAIEVNPDFAPAYNALGLAQLSSDGKLEDIIWLFEQTAEIEPQNPEAYFNMCRAYFQHQEADKAEAACLKALSINPEMGSAQLTLAWVYLMGKGDAPQSIAYFKKVLDKIKNPRIYLGLGMAYARNGDTGHVLEIVTQLRSQGEEVLANQLEKMIRPRGEIPEIPATLQAPPVPGEVSSKIVTAKPPVEPEPVLGTAPGTQKIQLRGRLLPPTIQPSAQTSTSDMDQDDEDEQSYRELTIKERMDKVRKMRGGARSGRATGTMNIQGATGTGTVQIIPPTQ